MNLTNEKQYSNDNEDNDYYYLEDYDSYEIHEIDKSKEEKIENDSSEIDDIITLYSDASSIFSRKQKQKKQNLIHMV